MRTFVYLGAYLIKWKYKHNKWLYWTHTDFRYTGNYFSSILDTEKTGLSKSGTTWRKIEIEKKANKLIFEDIEL